MPKAILILIMSRKLQKKKYCKQAKIKKKLHKKTVKQKKKKEYWQLVLFEMAKTIM